ncbi:CsbD family protein [Pseudonocardia spinosispora]|uniref:CsbD family protein n=1 Tax=Pseudonocardia spinosispora TaxID=103441 RepID=UPI0004240E4A|nr:CsbD family protein [Pseudonocardia spinosispora]
MGIVDKAKNKAEELKGKAKETTGRIIGDEELQAEGLVDQGKAGVKQAGESVKDAAKDVTRAFKK